MFHTNLTADDEKLSPDDAEIVDVIHSGGRWIGMDGVVIAKYQYICLCMRVIVLYRDFESIEGQVA